MPDIFEARDKTPKMLIADDDPAIVRLLADRCVKMGFKVETATNGMQLLIKARRSHPDILIVDVNMPELDGLSVCSRLLDPGSKPLEVVVVTGSTGSGNRRALRKPRYVLRPQGPRFLEQRGRRAGRNLSRTWRTRSSTSESQAIDAEVPQRPRVLVVDDDPDIEEFLASRLGKFGMDTLYAPDAVHGFRMASKDKPSVIITDNYMPDGDAQYLLYRLRSSPWRPRTFPSS